MKEAGSISLSDALNISIDRIVGGYADKWLITGEPEIESAGDQLNLLCCDNRYENVIELESHIFTELFICIQGSCALSLGNSIYDVDEGKICLIMPGIPHCELPKKDINYLAVWMAIDFDINAIHLSGKNKFDGFFFTIDGYTSRPSFEYTTIYGSLIKEFTEKDGRYIDIVKALILQILVITSRNIHASRSSRIDNKLWKESLVLQVQNFINRNYTGSIRLNDISQEVCVSVNYLNNIFKSITGKTIMQYLEDFKIDKAMQLLIKTDFTVNNIALKLGYCDQYYFSKAFKKSTGYSPTQFRKMS